MRKLCKSLALVLALCLLLSAGALASSFDSCANELSRMNLFKGTGGDYKTFDLERSPTRAEAAVMLVRLLGQENAAQKLPYAAPFTDVPAWAQPYVQYLYTNGLASGETADRFAPDALCSAQMFTAFLLRVLGYSEKSGDFIYENGLPFAREKGLVNNVNCDEQNFLRDHMVAMSYTVLSLRPVTGETDLLTKLVNSGALSQKDADYTLMHFTSYREYAQLVALSNQQASEHQTLTIDISTMRPPNLEDRSDIGTLTLDLNTDFTAQTGPTLSAVGKFTPKAGANYAAGDVAFYCKDGYFYWNLSGQKQKLPFDLKAFLAELERIAPDGLIPLCMSSNIGRGGEFGVDDALSRDTMVLFDVFNSLLQQAMKTGLLPSLADDLRGEALSLSIYTERGKLRLQAASVNVSVPFVDDFIAASLPDYKGRTNINFHLEQKNAAGAAKVSLPSDLSAYTRYQPKP